MNGLSGKWDYSKWVHPVMAGDKGLSGNHPPNNPPVRVLAQEYRLGNPQ
jgi:hypothetical protein